ncbi:transposase [Rhodoblastus acidophilus]|nr:transposase [Rhodoblastus acidophilus]MCW2335494.1 transposase [Rhodoblastus acidophilus]
MGQFSMEISRVGGSALSGNQHTGGNIADCTAGATLLERLPDFDILHADKGYDANELLRQVEDKGVMPNIPPKANRKWKNCFSPFLYRNRHAIERMFCRLKDFRRVATRYDRNAVNYLATVCLAATVSYWL